MEGILIVAHGSKSKEAREEFEKIVSGFREKSSHEYVAGCFLGVSSPKIPESLEKIYESGVRELTVVPYFLSSGGHILKDIPSILSENIGKYPGLNYRISKPIGFDERIVDILIERSKNDFEIM